MTKKTCLCATTLALLASADGFSIHQPLKTASSSLTKEKSGTLQMYLDGKNGQADVRTGRTTEALVDRTQLGTLEVPTVGVGTISWSSEKLLDLENLELQDLVDTALASNAAFFDTAERYGSHLKTMFGMGYGETEKLLRLFLERSNNSNTGDNSIVATKFTPLPWRTTAESVVEACQESCRRLGVEQLDLYQLHMPDIVQPLRAFGKEQDKNAIYWQGLAECYNRGLVKNVGVCNYGPTLLAQCQDALAQHNVPLASNQIAYSLIGQHNGAQETVDYCNEQGIKVLAFYPFAMGLLTGKYNAETLPRPDNNMLTTLTQSKKTKLEELELQRYATHMGPLLTVLHELAQRHNKTVAQVALNYVVCKGVVPIPGARNRAQLLDNVGAMGWRLSDDEVQLLETTADGLPGFDGAGFKRTSDKFVGYGVEKWRLE